jgi:hypothetical protein
MLSKIWVERHAPNVTLLTGKVYPIQYQFASLAYLVSPPLNKKVSLWSDSDRVSLKQVDSIVGFAYCQNDNKWMQRHVATKNL